MGNESRSLRRITGSQRNASAWFPGSLLRWSGGSGFSDATLLPLLVETLDIARRHFPNLNFEIGLKWLMAYPLSRFPIYWSPGDSWMWATCIRTDHEANDDGVSLVVAREIWWISELRASEVSHSSTTRYLRPIHGLRVHRCPTKLLQISQATFLFLHLFRYSYHITHQILLGMWEFSCSTFVVRFVWSVCSVILDAVCSMVLLHLIGMCCFLNAEILFHDWLLLLAYISCFLVFDLFSWEIFCLWYCCFELGAEILQVFLIGVCYFIQIFGLDRSLWFCFLLRNNLLYSFFNLIIFSWRIMKI